VLCVVPEHLCIVATEAKGGVDALASKLAAERAKVPISIPSPQPPSTFVFTNTYAQMCLVLANEQGMASMYHPYIAYLPPAVSQPALWSEDQLRAIAGTQIELDARYMRAQWDAAAARALPGLPAGITHDDWLFCRASVQNRAISFQRRVSLDPNNPNPLPNLMQVCCWHSIPTQRHNAHCDALLTPTPPFLPFLSRAKTGWKPSPRCCPT